MSRRFPVTLAIVLSAFVAPAVISAQQPAPAELEALIQEKQELDAKLQPLEQKALEDDALSAEQDQLTAALRAAIIAADPSIDASLERFQAIMAEAEAAQEAGDAEKVAALTTEAQTLQPQIEEAQAKALQQPELSAKLTAFRSKVDAQIVAIDPSAQQLLDRRRDVEQRLKKAITGADDNEGA